MTSYSISQHRCARCYDSKKTLPKKPRDWNICDRVSVVFIIASHKKIMWLLVNSRKKAICNLWPYINWLFRDRAVRFALPGIIGNFFKHSQIFCQWWLSVLYILETLRSVPVRFRKKKQNVGVIFASDVGWYLAVFADLQVIFVCLREDFGCNSTTSKYLRWWPTAFEFLRTTFGNVSVIHFQL